MFDIKRNADWTQHFVYIIGHSTMFGVTGPVKIGITANPNERLGALRTASPYPINFVCVFGTAGKELAARIEQAFHKSHAKIRTNGEWFDCSPTKAAEFIAEYYRLFIVSGYTCARLRWDEMVDILDLTGVTAVLEKLAGERYLSAWEQEAA